MRGEQYSNPGDVVFDPGSPPHARGAADNGGVVGRFVGITPACAGSRQTMAHPQPASGDHPRMRGEQIDNRYNMTENEGSPPHARGAD